MAYCIAIKNKNSPHIKCPRKAKPNCQFCGYHLKNPILFKEPYKELPKLDGIDPVKVKLTLTENSIYFKYNDTPRTLYNKLSNYFDHKDSYIKSIVLIQKRFKERHLNLKNRCINDKDFYSLDDIKEIPDIYFVYINENSFFYGFDIRSMDIYLKNTHSSKVINPYTNTKFTEDSIKKIKDKLEYLYKNNKLKSLKEEILTNKQKFNQFIFEVFRIYDDLGYIIQIEWFKKLSLFQLKRLYKEAEDIWNFRANLSLETKKKIAKDGIAFEISPNIIMKYPISKYKELQLIILKEFKRMVTEGETEAERKLGGMWMLTAFVEISPIVANAYPWLNQHNI